MRFLSQHLCQHGLFLLCVKVSSSVPSSGVDWRLKTVAGCSLLTLRSPSPVFLLRSGDHTWKTPVSVTSRPNITTEIRQIMSVLMTLPACRCCFLVCWWWKMKKKLFQVDTQHSLIYHIDIITICSMLMAMIRLKAQMSWIKIFLFAEPRLKLLNQIGRAVRVPTDRNKIVWRERKLKHGFMEILSAPTLTGLVTPAQI